MNEWIFIRHGHGIILFCARGTYVLLDADEAAQEAVARLKALLLEQGMLKRLIGLQGSIMIRTAAYSLLAVLCKR